MRVVRAGGQRINVHGSTDDEDAIQLASEHWHEEYRNAYAALEAIYGGGEVTVTEEPDLIYGGPGTLAPDGGDNMTDEAVEPELEEPEDDVEEEETEEDSDAEDEDGE